MLFANRVDAGRRLARRLEGLRGHDPVVVGLPRGGVPVAAEVACTLHAPLDVIVVRKVGLPTQPELAMGAIGEGDVRVRNEDVIAMTGVTDAQFAVVEQRERAELERRARRFRGDRVAVPLAGRTVVVVDDGIATGSTAQAACRVARAHGAARVVLAVPVAPADWIERLGDTADEYVCLQNPTPFHAVGQFYRDFATVTDDDVVASLERADCSPPQRNEEVEIRVDDVCLGGHLVTPPGAAGVVVFAHGSGSSRHSPRNRFIAGVLQQAGLGTLLFDLLSADEAAERANVFDIPVLSRRLTDVTRWLRTQPGLADVPVGYFGASTGAAAALWAASEPGADIAAVVSRGGRPDLADERLHLVRCPTLLIVGGDDDVVLGLNRRAASLLRCELRMAIVPGATHLFEEPGTLEQVSVLARDWFARHVARSGAPVPHR